MGRCRGAQVLTGITPGMADLGGVGIEVLLGALGDEKGVFAALVGLVV